ncbi:cytochrome b/b6 domain-containing protein [Paracoccus sp. AK26]|uniref:cytochrome b/b6 domain-containing protein n=1 Tax=Paracoccus sp. AK26 TaxID=2589076 RepID=UPI0014287654|nr:cytochrome b/b6 domain-containing protein [Paracoccus sp. AK26]QIR86799.1 cytochrome B [Paracoccus sp. AK26]
MTDRVRVWDGFVRLFHWSLVGLIAGTWLTADGPKLWHEGMGYAVVGLIAARLVWGFVGPRHARFGDFVRGPRAVLDYLRALRAGREPRYLGHNPAGGAMIVALLMAVSGTALTGWLQTTDAFWGSEVMEEVHEALATLILVLAGLHVAGVVVESLRHRENLVLSMLTGTKRPLAATDRP